MIFNFKRFQIKIEFFSSGDKESVCFVVLMGIVFLIGIVSLHFLFDNQFKTPEVEAGGASTYQFTSVSSTIVTGGRINIQANIAAATEGVNTGSFRGTLADDNLHWAVSSTASGININLEVGGVQLNGANMLIIQTEIDEDATAPALGFQICDWVSSTGVDAAVDTQCTGGGWRTINPNKTTLAPTTATAYNFFVYDGYWASGGAGGTTISTPLSYFINGSNKIKIRYFSTTNTTSALAIDYLRVHAVINPLYQPASSTKISGGNLFGTYASTTFGTAAATIVGSDDARFTASSTAGVAADFYFSFKNVEIYTGMNSILYRAEYSCSATGNNIMPKIYNFTSVSWENLSALSIPCITTDVTNAWAKSNININDYVSGGEIRVGWYATTTGTQAIRIDYNYLMVGSTYATGNTSEISFGTLSANTATSTQNLDMSYSLATTTWNVAAEAESNNMTHDFYPFNTDNDTVIEKAYSANIDMSVAPPSNAAVTGLYFAGRFSSGSTSTISLSLRDYSGFTSVQGGWVNVGATAGSATAYTYTDNITVGGVATGGSAGYLTNPEDFIDTVNGKMNMQVRTVSAITTSTLPIGKWDFAFVSLQWVETAAAGPTISCSTNTTSTNFGSFTSEVITTSTPNASTTMSCSGTSLGCTLYINDTGGGSPTPQPGLWNSTSSALIESPNAAFSATSTLVADTEGYGIRATSTASGSGTLNINIRYNQGGFSDVNTVGGLATTTITLASSTADVTNREIVVTHKAAASSTTPTGSYNDTITYSCLINY